MGAEPRAGDVVSEKYVIERSLGRGGMGAVFSARHVKLGHRVALKFLTRGGSPAMVARFLREARAAAALDSDHVARVFDAGEHPQHGPYLVMELLAGKDLAAVSRERGPLSQEQAVDLVMQAGLGLSAAHAAGILHRDLKPANLFLAERSDGTSLVKVLDFGISKLLSERGIGEQDGEQTGASTTLTQTGVVMGSPRYMSPEQLEGAADIDERSDLWALGVILHELLRGAPPFEGRSFAELRAQIAGAPPPSVRVDRPELSVELEAVILRCLDKAPSRRFASAAELLAALAPFGPPHAGALAARAAHSLGGRGADTEPPSGAEPTDRGPFETSPPVSRTGANSTAARVPADTRAPERRRPRVPFALAGALALVLAGAAGARLWPGSAEPGAPSPHLPTDDDDRGREELARANEARKAGDRESAHAAFQKLLSAALAEGVTPGSPRAKVAAAAQLALSDMAAEALEAPRGAAELGLAWEPMHTLRRQTFEGMRAYGDVIKWHDLGAVQCAVAGQARLHERHADILAGLAIPPMGAAPPDRGPQSPEEVKRGYATERESALETALDLYRNAAGRPVPRGEGCREEASRGEERVSRALTALGHPGP